MSKSLLILVSHVSFFVSHRLDLAIAAKKMGYDVKVAFGEIDTDIKFLADLGIDCFHVPIERGGTNIIKDLKSIYYIWKLLKKLCPDVVHLVTIKPYLYGGIASRIARIPCVVSAISGLGSLFVHSNFTNKLFRFFIYPIYKFALNHPNQFIVVQNNEDANVLIKWGVLDFRKIRLIKGSGVKLDEFISKEEPPGTPRVCFAARLLIDKGIYEFVTAADLLNKRGINVQFCVAGDIDSKNPTSLSNEDLNKLKRNENVVILGYQSDIKSLYANSHIVCLPSYREGLPKALVEAAAASRAVVTTDVPGCKDAIIPNETGILVPIKNPIKLADAIQWLVEHPNERVLMGKAGRKLALNEFKIEKIIKQHFVIYEDLLRKT
tara:strand:+ start:1250 stop:2383 length:1134 start_codon:yes stop_codon:yes gene_type:complete